MARNVFPYPHDRDAIDAFICGQSYDNLERYREHPLRVVSSGQRLMIHQEIKVDDAAVVEAGSPNINVTNVAWRDTQGAIVTMLPSGVNTHYVVRTLNQLLEDLGDTRRVGYINLPGSVSQVVVRDWSGDERHVDAGEIIVIAGTLSVMAGAARKRIGVQERSLAEIMGSSV